MPVVSVVRGLRIVYESVPWPAECKLRARATEDLTPDEIKAEIAILMTDREEDLHRAYCSNPACPAKR